MSSSCNACPLGPGPQVVGEGPVPCRVMVIGEAPGYQEAKQGRPFVGPSGEKLNEYLTLAGWSRADVYVTNLVACRPPGIGCRRKRNDWLVGAG